MNTAASLQADLRWLLPLKSGQAAWIPGEAPELEEALTRDGVWVIKTPSHPQDKDEFLIAPLMEEHLTDLWLKTILTQPGSAHTVLLGFAHTPSLHQFKKKMLPGSHFYSLRHIQQIFIGCGCVIEKLYGVYDSLAHPRFTIPLDSPGAVRFFFTSLFTAYTPSGRWLQRLAPFFTAIGQPHMLFPGLVLIARKPAEVLEQR
jgi:hypothetical protein